MSSNPAIQAATNRDARLRGTRALTWGLLIDVAIAVVIVLLPAFSAIEWTRAYWITLGLSVTKSVLQAIVTYAARKLLPPAGTTNPF